MCRYTSEGTFYYRSIRVWKRNARKFVDASSFLDLDQMSDSDYFDFSPAEMTSMTLRPTRGNKILLPLSCRPWTREEAALYRIPILKWAKMASYVGGVFTEIAKIIWIGYLNTMDYVKYLISTYFKWLGYQFIYNWDEITSFVIFMPMNALVQISGIKRYLFSSFLNQEYVYYIRYMYLSVPTAAILISYTDFQAVYFWWPNFWWPISYDDLKCIHRLKIEITW